MKHWQLSGSTALLLVLSASASWAVTPEEVWANWQTMVTAAGGTVQGTATRTGDTLEAAGVALSYTDPELGGTVSTTFDRLAFRDRGDGTVEITVPATYPFALKDVPDGPASFVATLDQKGLTIIASGTAEATGYDISADEYTLTLGQFTEKDGVTPVDLMAKIAVTALAAKYAVTPGQNGATGLETTASAASTTIDLVARDVDQGMEAVFNATIGATQATTKGMFVGAELMADMSKALKAGFFVDSTTTVGPMTVKGNFAETGTTGTIDAALSGMTAKIALDSTRVDYGFGLTGADITMTGSDLPLPEIKTAFGELSFNLMLPIAMSDTPQGYGANFRLVDLTAADLIWSMVDPGGQLKRDPMTFIVDLAGTGRWTADIMDPAVQAQGTPPLELNSLDLTQVLFKALGGQIDATGGFTFDNTDLMTFGGIPAPTGKVTANLKGINALIDTAVSMGLVPEDDVMSVRLGLAMFAKPGAGPDEMVSEIEFKDKGLFVNGQQLQ